MKIHLKVVTIFTIVMLLNACATYNPQYKNSFRITNISNNDILHSFYLIGDAGNSPLDSVSSALNSFKSELDNAGENSTAIFLGDNIYPNGLPKDDGSAERTNAKHQLNTQINAVSNFKGNTIFIPGNHDWYSNGLKGLERQEKFIENKLGKDSFLPENGCPLERVKISDELEMIIINTEWYLTSWDKHPTINDDCEIKTRFKFFIELESLIKKARGKTTIIAMHHPMFTNGPHGGQYTLKQQLFVTEENKIPLPILGSVANLVRKTSGISPADVQNKRYTEFKKRLVTLAQENDKVILVSGHEHSLQYLEQDNLPQIISGAGTKSTGTRNVGGGQFTYATPGYARLDVLKNGSSYVRFYSSDDDKMVFQKEIFPTDDYIEIKEYSDDFPATKTASIYTEEETDKGGIYRALWGKRYRKYYSTNVTVPTVNLDTIFGGLVPVRKGGGHQSKSLRLEDANGREYVMRALRKNAVQFLQAVAFQQQYIEGQFEDTYTEGLLLDVFTGSHPYMPFAIGAIADAVNVYHTNPVLYYVPKQSALKNFNDEFGGELYMIEERAASGHGDNASFGFADKVISTDDMFKNLRKDEKYKVDEEFYLRARLLDMILGDWDRHEDQWRWAEFKEDENIVYRPVPRDRDQAFSIMGDGALLSFITTIEPTLRQMKAYKKDLKNPKWFNASPYALDMALINMANKDIWDAQVKYIQENLTDDVIDQAFANLPEEVNDETVREIMLKLKGRRATLQQISDDYYHHINRYAVVKGTDKDDWFDIERQANGMTKVTGYRIKKGKKSTIFHERLYSSNITKHLWLYGLDDQDTFKVFGTGDHLIKVTIVGGQNKDTYHIENGKKVKIFDYKSKASEFVTNKGRVKLIDDYETNVYDYKKLKNTTNQIIPTLGTNPDDGFKIGLVDTYTIYDFERNPFTSRHVFTGAYYFATQGFDLNYNGEFSNVIGKWNVGLDAIYTSPNYAINFFNFGSETTNFEANGGPFDVDLDFNRVKFSKIKFAPSLIRKGELGSVFKAGVSYESIKVEQTANRFINFYYLATGEPTQKDFVGLETSYSFENVDNKAFPTLGMRTNLQIGYKADTDGFNGFGYVVPSIGFDYKLVPSGSLVLATKFKGHITLGDDFEFYQAPSLGANNGLRGYRNERFTGKNAFYQSTDIRLNLRKVRTSLLPLNIGLYGGVDYGRVWVKNDTSDKWNNSVGAGFFANAADIFTVNLSAFTGADGMRIAFKLGFGF